MKLICISGKRRSGKTTLANILWKEYGYKPISLAGPLKRMCMEHFDLSYDQVEGHLKEVSDPRYLATPREMMIGMGQFYRSFNPSFWIQKTLQIIESYSDQPCVVPDMRFMNERNAFIKEGAFMVRLERREDLTGKYIDDPSETELDVLEPGAWDYHVPCARNVNITDLERAAQRIYELSHATRLI